MATDMFTKHFVNPHKWQHALHLIGMVDAKCVQQITNDTKDYLNKQNKVTKVKVENVATKAACAIVRKHTPPHRPQRGNLRVINKLLMSTMLLSSCLVNCSSYHTNDQCDPATPILHCTAMASSSGLGGASSGSAAMDVDEQQLVHPLASDSRGRSAG